MGQLSGSWRLLILGCLGLTGAFLWWLVPRDEGEVPPGVSHSAYWQFRERLDDQLDRTVETEDVLTALAKRALAKNEWDEARSALEAIPVQHARYGGWAAFRRAECLLELHLARPAEEALQVFLQLESPQPRCQPAWWAQARDRLDYLLVLQLRFEERQELLKRRLALGEMDRFAALEYCFPTLQFWSHPQARAQLEAFYAKSPGDIRLQIALGRYRAAEGLYEQALEILHACNRNHPQDPRVQAALLECFWRQQDQERFTQTIQSIPPPTGDAPWLLWRLWGHHANAQGDPEAAVAYFEELLKRNPTDVGAYRGLTQAFAKLDRSEDSASAAERTRALARIRNRMSWAQKDSTDLEPFVCIVELCKSVGFDQQAHTLARVAQRTTKGDPRLDELLIRSRGETP